MQAGYSEPPLLSQLDGCFQKPEGWVWEWLDRPGGGRLRMGICIPNRATNLVLIIPGRREFGEKYFELARDFLSRKCAVATFEWSGQGLSGRPLPQYDCQHVEHFDDYCEDLGSFFREIRARPSLRSLPVFMTAHSMGATIAMLYAQKHTYPFDVRRICLTAPMIEIRLNRWQKQLARKLAGNHVRKGREDRFIAGTGVWTLRQERRIETLLSTDPRRAGVETCWMYRNPALRVMGPSWGWLNAAFEACRALRETPFSHGGPGPMLVLGAGQEHPGPPCFHTLPNARHDIWMEHDGVRHSALERLCDFFGFEISQKQ